MSKRRTFGLLVQKRSDQPPTFSAGVVWGAMPFLTGVEEGPTPEAAVAALEGAVRRLGYDPTVLVFDTLEAAQAEGRRRIGAEDVLHHLHLAAGRLPELLAGEGDAADERDRQVLEGLDRAIRAIRAVAESAYDEEKLEARVPIRDGRIVCPNADCDPSDPDIYFTATADALTTAHLSPTGDLRTWKDVSVSDEGYREVRCGACGTDLGDLTLEDLHALGDHPKKEEDEPEAPPC